ncbi:MAG: serine/threonine-protein kinase [Minicystis sp.]
MRLTPTQPHQNTWIAVFTNLVYTDPVPLTLRMDPAASPPPDLGSDEGSAVARPVSPGAAVSVARKAARARRCPSCEQAFSGEARFCPFDGDALVDAPDWNPAADPLIGQTVDGRYQVTGVLGEGGMGTVYEVRHTTLGRRFALKVLRRDIADAEHTARFIQEAKAAAAIGHPNIVAVSDFGEITVPAPAESGKRPAAGTPVPYFVMEYLTGISLAALLRSEKTLDAARAAQIVLQCASGLAAAHAAGVIHRDLKPDNVFLTRSGDREFVKLLDFGVAKMAGAGRLTRAGMVFGTPHYMSPEQAAGQSVDLRADVYALGVILYECLAGRVPFEADTYMGVLTKHMFATPEPIDRMVPDGSRLGSLAPIVMRCLAKNPQERYASMAELVSALEAALEASARRAGSLRPGGRRGDSLDPPETPGLRPVVGPIGVGLGVVALALAGLLAFRGGRSPADTAASATASVTAAPPAVSSASSATTTVPAAVDTATAGASAVPAVATAPVTSATAAVPSATAAATGTSSSTPRARPGGSKPPSEPRRHPGGDVVDPWGH